MTTLKKMKKKKEGRKQKQMDLKSRLHPYRIERCIRSIVIMNKIINNPFGINYILLQMHCIFLQFGSAICSWIVKISESHATNDIHGSSQFFFFKKKNHHQNKHNSWLYACMLFMQPFQEIYA